MDIAGANIYELQEELINGNTVMVWHEYGKDKWGNSLHGWLKTSSKLHCVVLCGFDYNHVYINAPWD